MARFFREPDRRQRYLLPVDMMDWLPEGDIVHLIVDAVALMDLSGFEATCKVGKAGQAPFSPRVLLALLIYAYSHGIRSSRVIERLCGRDVGYRFIVGAAVPDHSVIARFRQRHVERMKAVFLAVLELCRAAGLIRLGLVALDGTKVKANAALAANRTASSIEAEIARMLAEAEAVDAREDRQFQDQRGDGLPEGLTKAADRQARLMACKAKLEKRAAEAVARQQAKIDARRVEEQATGKRRRGRKPKAPDPTVDPDAVANVTDPESGIMKTRQGWVQGYNAQIVVTRDQIILAADVTTEANDSHQLTGMLNQAQANVEIVLGEDAVLGAAGRGLLVRRERCRRDRRVRAAYRHAEGPQATRGPARGAAAARAHAEADDGAGAHGAQAADQAGPQPLSPARAKRRAGFRADEGPSRRRPVQHAWDGPLPWRVAARRRGP